MALPDFNEAGDLPPEVHRATLDEILERFGSGSARRTACARRLAHIFELARRTGSLRFLIVFGSFVTRKEEPNDVDVILIMDDAFQLEKCPTNRARSLSMRLLRRAWVQASSGFAPVC